MNGSSTTTGLKRWFWLVMVLSLLAVAQQTNPEDLRPQYHFTPPSGWMNDPNGLLYYGGEYHLFYQHNPAGIRWGPMHWGHTVSSDLVHWQHLPIALEPDKNGTIFSGSAVVDSQNSTGFGTDALVAIFTQDQSGTQQQSLAYSQDYGRNWLKYGGNSVLKPGDLKNFRDPKVFWYDPGKGTGHWVMALAVGNSVLFYKSPDLKNWESTGGFGFNFGATCGVWETPDLFQLPIQGSSDKRWVLSVGINNCAPAGGTGTQYFVGQFDGKTFKSENPKNTVLWADYGADFYAAQSWNNTPDGRRIWVGWMNNWRYAQDIPASTWRGAFTLPRVLGLIKTPQGLRLIQNPIAELGQLRQKSKIWENLKLSNNTQTLEGISGETLEIIATLKPDKAFPPQRLGIRVRVGKKEQTVIGYATRSASLYVDRSHSGQTDFSTAFPAAHVVDVKPALDEIQLHIFVDRTSVEVFAQNGLYSMTESIFPGRNSRGLQVFAERGKATVSHLEVYTLGSALQ